MNFFRTAYLNRKNKKIVKACKEEDMLFILKHLFEQDYKHPELCSDEYFSSRTGMRMILEDIKGDKLEILDVACGNGELLKKLQDKGHSVFGIDLSPVRVLLNKSNLSNLNLSSAEKINLPSNKFDVVIALETLEHVMNLEKTIQEVKRLLKVGGVFYVQVPDGNYADGNNHVRLFTEMTLRESLEQGGLKVESLERISYLKGEEKRNLYVKAKKYIY